MLRMPFVFYIGKRDDEIEAILMCLLASVHFIGIIYIVFHNNKDEELMVSFLDWLLNLLFSFVFFNFITYVFLVKKERNLWLCDGFQANNNKWAK